MHFGLKNKQRRLLKELIQIQANGMDGTGDQRVTYFLMGHFSSHQMSSTSLYVAASHNIAEVIKYNLNLNLPETFALDAKNSLQTPLHLVAKNSCSEATGICLSHRASSLLLKPKQMYTICSRWLDTVEVINCWMPQMRFVYF
ncbi:uncharacterized protein [Rutidosis leptorrhynchoides]|uniref:uncharacterized protein n=1 Tax=Rutidosis leptorrhynchoides TaxID=125765 RepID=UPI003A99906F